MRGGVNFCLNPARLFLHFVFPRRFSRRCQNRITNHYDQFFHVKNTSPSANDGDFFGRPAPAAKTIGLHPLTGRPSERFEKPFAASCCCAGSSFGGSCGNNKIATITWYRSPEGIRRRAS